MKNLSFHNVTTAVIIALGLISGAASAAPVYDTIIRNARIIDGTGAPWYRGDIAITSDTITAVGYVDPESSATTVIDADGRYVAPGFIDVHTHCEGDFDDNPEAENFIRMGVTTVITGNCGGSAVAVGDSLTTLSGYALGPNVGTLIGHNSVRRRVMGNDNRDPETTELLEMRRLVRDAMADGAMGMSTGLIYTPGTYSKTPEIVALAKEVAAFGGVYVTHMRGEGNSIFSALREALQIGREADIPVHISHFKVSASKFHGASTQTLAMVKEAREAGQDVTVDQYAYTASSTSLRSIFPDDIMAGSRFEQVARLTDPTTRSLVRERIIKSARAGRGSYEYAHVANFNADRSVNGMNIKEIARKWKGDDSLEAQVDVIIDMQTSGGAGMVYHTMSEEDVQRIMAYPDTMFASDSGVRVLGRAVPHPRGYGNNARVLGHYTRDLKVLRLEDAVRKMTSLPARTMRIDDRGVLRPGMAADVVVFDLDRVNDPSTFKAPHAYAEGFDYVFVNGAAIIRDGELTEERGGRPLYGPWAKK